MLSSLSSRWALSIQVHKEVTKVYESEMRPEALFTTCLRVPSCVRKEIVIVALLTPIFDNLQRFRFSQDKYRSTYERT